MEIITEKPVALACDHAGFTLKEAVKKHLEEAGVAYVDLGTNSTESVDYPVFAASLCKEIQTADVELGILICGTGVGMSMAANKHKGIRAACVSDTFSAKATRMHNNANVICFGERVVGQGLAFEIVDAFLTTPYEGGRHERRVKLLEDIEKSQK